MTDRAAAAAMTALARAQTLRAGRSASPARWEAAARRAVAEGIQVRQVNDTGMWIATSGSDSGCAYTLEILNGMVLSCSCEAAARWGDPVCKHRARYYLDRGVLALSVPADGEGRHE